MNKCQEEQQHNLGWIKGNQQQFKMNKRREYGSNGC
jgi:hypothetical protein